MTRRWAWIVLFALLWMISTGVLHVASHLDRPDAGHCTTCVLLHAFVAVALVCLAVGGPSTKGYALVPIPMRDQARVLCFRHDGRGPPDFR
ncbi:MAG TPA: hypothetical protein VGO93_30110 [Candidatus Xenobia bacterium]